MTTIDTTPEAIAALLNGVTPGPWRVEHETTLIWGHCDQDDVTDRGMGYPVSECRITPISSWASGPDAESGEANARFIAAARELVPALAAEIARLTAALDAANDRANFAGLREEQKWYHVVKVLKAECDEVRAQVAMAYEVAAKLADSHVVELEPKAAKYRKAGNELSEAVFDSAISEAKSIAVGIRARTPADATAALARRDAAMRNEGRRQAAKACDWGDIYGDNAVRAILAALEPEGGE